MFMYFFTLILFLYTYYIFATEQQHLLDVDSQPFLVAENLTFEESTLCQRKQLDSSEIQNLKFLIKDLFSKNEEKINNLLNICSSKFDINKSLDRQSEKLELHLKNKFDILEEKNLERHCELRNELSTIISSTIETEIKKNISAVTNLQTDFLDFFNKKLLPSLVSEAIVVTLHDLNENLFSSIREFLNDSEGRIVKDLKSYIKSKENKSLTKEIMVRMILENLKHDKKMHLLLYLLNKKEKTSASPCKEDELSFN